MGMRLLKSGTFCFVLRFVTHCVLPYGGYGITGRSVVVGRGR